MYRKCNYALRAAFIYFKFPFFVCLRFHNLSYTHRIKVSPNTIFLLLLRYFAFQFATNKKIIILQSDFFACFHKCRKNGKLQSRLASVYEGKILNIFTHFSSCVFISNINEEMGRWSMKFCDLIFHKKKILRLNFDRLINKFFKEFSSLRKNRSTWLYLWKGKHAAGYVNIYVCSLLPSSCNNNITVSIIKEHVRSFWNSWAKLLRDN